MLNSTDQQAKLITEIEQIVPLSKRRRWPDELAKLRPTLPGQSPARKEKKMLVAERMHEARNEQEVYQLLNAYIDGTGCGVERRYLLEDTPRLPSCTNDVMQRWSELLVELDAASQRLDDQACLALNDALQVFSNALLRLSLLERAHQRPLATYLARHRQWQASVGSKPASRGRSR